MKLLTIEEKKILIKALNIAIQDYNQGIRVLINDKTQQNEEVLKTISKETLEKERDIIANILDTIN